MPIRPLSESRKTETFKELGVDGAKLRKAGVTWFGEIFNYFAKFYDSGNGAEVLTDQSRVIRTIAVRVALASLGGGVLQDDLEGNGDTRTTLEKVNWIVDTR